MRLHRCDFILQRKNIRVHLDKPVTRLEVAAALNPNLKSKGRVDGHAWRGQGTGTHVD